MERFCVSCGGLFQPNPRVKKQRYCSKPACQRERRRQWQKRKLAEDEDYRFNQAEAQRRWCERHSGYWRSYRKKHPGYVRRNRELQRKRNRTRVRGWDGKPETAERMIAKMYELNITKEMTSGVYRLIPITPGDIAKMDELNNRLAIIYEAGDGP